MCIIGLFKLQMAGTANSIYFNCFFSVPKYIHFEGLLKDLRTLLKFVEQ